MLKHIDLFAGLPDSAIDALMRCAKPHRYPKNAVILNEGDSENNFYIVAAGTLKVYVHGEGGRQVTLNWLEAGDYFGELALIDGEARSASVMTLSPTELKVISQHDFHHLLRSDQDIALALMKALARRVRALTASVRDLALLDVYGRVSALLQGRANAETGCIEPRLTHSEIADVVGASREMVSRVMRELALGGYIEQSASALYLRKRLPQGW